MFIIILCLFSLMYMTNSLKITMNNDGFLMQKKILGTSNLEVSEICLGTMTWGKQNTNDEAAEQLDYYFKEAGGNFLDTAEMYPVPTEASTQGLTDLAIAKWMKDSKFDRSKMILATKVCGASDRITWLPGQGREKGARVSRQQILDSVDASLKRLNTDYIDLLQIHWPDRYVPIFGSQSYDFKQEKADFISFEEQLEAMQSLVKQGKVRHIGVSNETPYGVMKFCQIAEQMGLPRICSIQNSYSLIVRTQIEQGLSEVCSPMNENVGLLAYSPLAGGILSGKYRKSKEETKNSRLTLFPGFMERYLQSDAVEAVNKYCSLAEEIDISPTEFALAWCYNRKEVASSIIGATSLEQLKENMNAVQYKSLFDDEEINSKIDTIHKSCMDPSKV